MPARDAIVLVPFTQLLTPARRAFADGQRWLPRIETTQTLAASLGPTALVQPDQLSFDPGIDALTATRLLRSQAWGLEWSRRDPRGFERATRDVMNTAQALAHAAARRPPALRAAHWDLGRALLSPQRGPGDAERRLARFALEWAALAVEPATDRLFSLRPAAWVLVQAGGGDALAEALMQHAPDGIPCLVINADAVAAQTMADSPSLAICESFEDEAQASAAQVLHHLSRDEHPVALIAQDRVLVRRVRALLERQQVPLLDETGWTLSTTRAAAQVMLLLRAAAPGADSDTLLAWLKGLESWPGRADTAFVDRLETWCRKTNLRRVDAIRRASSEGPWQAVWAEIDAVLQAFDLPAAAPLARWIDVLADALADCGALASLQADEAGRQVLAALHLGSISASWRDAAGRTVMDLPGFTAWVDGVFEAQVFHPPYTAEASPQVIITPLARAMLRPFAAVVFPGVDDSRLGTPPAPHPLLSDKQLAPLGLPDAAMQREREALAFGHIVATPRLTLLRRRRDNGNPLADSPLVERLALALSQRGRGLAPWQDPRGLIELPRTPVRRPSPPAPHMLPPRLSASAAEALRDCPYRFFAQHLLRLREDDELGDDVEKRNYGTWLHEVLLEFHATRGAPDSAQAEAQRLRALAPQHQQRLGLDDAAFVPFAASFDTFVPRYIEWLHERDAAGARWQHGELPIEIAPDELGGTRLYGELDRVDAVQDEARTALELIDYKTGSVDSLRKKVARPLEDTQLAFYAALMAEREPAAALHAMYLALDSSKGIEAIAHRGVEHSATLLVQGLAHDLQRLRAGAGLPALGEGRTCEHCASRGECRRDHWTLEGEP